MQVSLIVCLTVLVLAISGFLMGRRQAVARASVRGERLHSLPNYYGYYVALWTGLPALILFAIYLAFGNSLVNVMTVQTLEGEAAPLIRAYEADLANSQTHSDLLNIRAGLAIDIEALRGRIATGQGSESQTVAWSRDMERLSDRAVENVRAIEGLRAQLASNVMARAPTSEAGLRARAGFQLWRASPEARRVMVLDARAIGFGTGLASQRTREIEALARALYRPDAVLRWSSLGLVLALGIAMLTWTRSRITPTFRARVRVETLINVGLALASAIAILTTFGIVSSLFIESVRFFGAIDWRIHEFLLGLQWSPQIAIRADQVGQTGAFGAVPLFAGTALITLIAMAVAAPIGLLSAIYLSEYSNSAFRAWAKPLLEVLAGVPTVVYGFFALLTVGPFLREVALFLGYENAVTQSALSAGLVMGVMIIPFVSSLSDDVINAVPQSLRDGSYAMGATKSETITRVVLPAALPGIVGSLLLGVSRAVGETMIVVMAAGQGANLTANPLDSVTTITAQIVMLLTGDQEFDGAKTLSAFALGLVLFILTLILNVIALRVVQRFRERYE